MSYWLWLLILFVIAGALFYIAYRRDRRQGVPPEEPFLEKISDWLAEPDNAAKFVIASWIAALILGLVWWAYTRPDSPLTRVVLCILAVLFIVVPTILGYLGLFWEVVGGIGDLVGWIRGSGSKER